HRVAPMREISIVLGAILGAKLLGEAQGRRRIIGATIMVLGVLCLTGCSVERPVYTPVYDRLLDLRIATPLPEPAFEPGEITDEAEIQYRAAFVFYRQKRWSYAAAAFSET